MNNAKEHSVIFNAQEAIDTLNCFKTQHRVPVKNVPTGDIALGQRTLLINRDGIERWHWLGAGKTHLVYGDEFKCPFGKVGDRLWVKEPFIPDPPAGHDAWEDEHNFTNYYSWDGCGSKLSEIPKRLRKPEHVIYKASWTNPDSMIWVSASQMRKWASRLLLEITNIRIEHIQDISRADALGMGLKQLSKDGGRTYKYGLPDKDGLPGTDNIGWHWSDWEIDHKKAIARLWDSTYGEGAWQRNDWVWALKFKALERASNT